MKIKSILITTLAGLLLQTAVSAHDHIPAGALDTNNNGQPDQGEPLAFIGYSGTAKTYHLLARPFGYRPTLRCGGFYSLDEQPRTLFPTDSFSFIALSDGQFDIAASGHAHTGAYIWLKIVSVTGPSGAKFGFWEQDSSAYFDTPTVTFPANQPVPNFEFVLSEGLDATGEDPFGHIHGRAWTADTPGEYVVGMQLVDRSTNSPNGQPWHAPSQIYYYRFTAGPSFQPTQLTTGSGGTNLVWPSQLGYYAANPSETGITFQIQKRTTLTSGSWQTIGSVVGTTGTWASFTDTTGTGPRAFYRLNYTWAPQ